ncbi:MAG: sugar ABC transporter permease [Oscillospiraceae bacterium]|nr:sugar ABC transporter permease [Oscillospiraceae bacterium]
MNTQSIKNPSGHGEWRNWVLPYILVAPLMIWLIATILIPVVTVVYESVTSATFVGTVGDFVGFKNYVSVLKDPHYWAAWRNSIGWIVGCTILQTILGFSLALLLNSSTGRLGQFARTWSIVAWITPTVVVSLIWRWIFNGSYGIFNAFLMTIGVISEPLSLLGHPNTALMTAIFINVWRWFAFTAVILLAGLSTIPKELYESASVDGAGIMQKFFSITMPSLQNVTFALVIVGTLWCFNIFDQIWLLTLGGPLNATTTVPVYLYRGAFESFQIGRTAAASVITALLLLLLAAGLIKLTQPKD